MFKSTGPLHAKPIWAVLEQWPGASRAHRVEDGDGIEYLAKGTVFDPMNMRGPANELITAQLCEKLDIAVPEYQVLEHEDGLLFGSVVIPRVAPRFFDTIHENSVNGEFVYRVAAMDVWLCNGDRHDRNILAARIDDDTGDPQYRLYAIDHERAILRPDQRIEDLERQTRMGSQEFVGALRSYIKDLEGLAEPVEDIEALPVQDIRELVGNVPDPWLSTDEKMAYVSFLDERRKLLREILKNL